MTGLHHLYCRRGGHSARCSWRSGRRCADGHMVQEALAVGGGIVFLFPSITSIHTLASPKQNSRAMRTLVLPALLAALLALSESVKADWASGGEETESGDVELVGEAREGGGGAVAAAAGPALDWCPLVAPLPSSPVSRTA